MNNGINNIGTPSQQNVTPIHTVGSGTEQLPSYWSNDKIYNEYFNQASQEDKELFNKWYKLQNLNDGPYNVFKLFKNSPETIDKLLREHAPTDLNGINVKQWWIDSTQKAQEWYNNKLNTSSTLTESEKAQALAEEQQQKLWNREDEIRKHTEEREDNAYQRAIEDMRKAGINPNLFAVSPSASGGGITNASNTLSVLTQGMSNESQQLIASAQRELDLLLKEMDIDQKKKDRIASSISSFLNVVTLGLMRK